MGDKQVITLKANTSKTFSESEVALSEVSRLLIRLAKSRKAISKIQEIIDLTGVVARLTSALQKQGNGNGEAQESGGFGDPTHFAKISVPSKTSGLIR